MIELHDYLRFGDKEVCKSSSKVIYAKPQL